MLERSFADANGLPDAGAVRLAGGSDLRYTGWAFHPQWFLPTGSGIGLGTEGGYAVVFAPLDTAQRAAGRPGEVNEIVVRGDPGIDPAELERRVRGAMDRAFPGVGATFTRGSDEPAYRLLYRDAEGDQKIWRVLALLVLVGAALAAYNLTSRTVEAQRREIGIGMAIGVPPARLALRPLLMGAQIAVLGVVFGVVIGLLLSRLFGALLAELLPLPVHQTPFQIGQFAIGAAIGFALPFLGVLLPVWRAVRMRPIDAIRVGFRAAAGGGLAPLLAKVRTPGDTLVQMPLRNVVRAPRRTAVTVLGIGAILALVVSFSGLIDSFLQPVDRARVEAERVAPDRLVVALDRFRPVDGATVTGIRDTPEVGVARPQNTLAVTLGNGREEIDAALTFFDPAAPGWLPSLREGDFTRRSGGVLLARQAARDLGVEVGEEILVRHPVVEGADRVRLATSRVVVDGIHGGTLRPYAYGAAAAWGARTGLGGAANQVEVVPAAGATDDQVVRALFGRAGVASVESVAAPLRAFDEGIDRFLWFIYVTEAFVLLLALLVAFNSAAISADERRREHATMFAYGVPRRTVLLQSIAENGVIGLLASVVGVLIGTLIVGWIVRSIIPQTVPDIEVGVVVDAGTFLTVAVIGVAACALAPLFTARRLRRMDVPGTLRVME
jgi:putative ABC transport system permease protein